MADNDFENNEYDEEEEESPEKFPEDQLHGEYDHIHPEGVDYKLLNSKEARRKAEEDSRLLANRIALLKLEERKAWKKIEETKKKATQIVNQRKRNQKVAKEREERRIQKEREKERLMERNRQIKEQLKENIEHKKREVFHSK